MLLGFWATGQSPITITQANFPVFGTQNYDQTASPTPNIVPSANGSWNLANLHSSTPVTNDYIPETDPFYTSAGVDVYISDFKNLTTSLGYYVFTEYDFNATGVEDKGIYVPEQHYGLNSFTGNTHDSLTFPLQGYIFPASRQVMTFPATYQTGWHSKSRRVNNFNLTVTAAGLNKTPCKHIYTVFRNDTIVGWGKARVYTPSGPSVYYDVLIDKINQYTVDSFLVNGAPAPPALLTAFGMTQGQQTAYNNRYSLYRSGNSAAMVIYNYGTNLYTVPTAGFADTDNLTVTAVTEPGDGSYTTVLFPNPGIGNVINIRITGVIPAIRAYQIVDMAGSVVQAGRAELQNGDWQILLSPAIPNGHYVISATSPDNQTVITEQFMLAR